MESKQAALEHFLRTYDPVVSAHGLVWSNSYSGWMRKTPIGSQRLLVTSANYNPAYLFQITILQRVARVADIVGDVLGLSAKDVRHVSTTTTPLGFYTGDINERILIEAPGDIEARRPEITAALGEVVRNLDEDRDVATLFGKAHAWKGDHGIDYDISHLPQRALNLCALSRLYGVGDYDALCAGFFEQLRGYPPPDSARLGQLMLRLDATG